jgi:hypothetical protein
MIIKNSTRVVHICTVAAAGMILPSRSAPVNQ